MLRDYGIIFLFYPQRTLSFKLVLYIRIITYIVMVNLYQQKNLLLTLLRPYSVEVLLVISFRDPRPPHMTKGPCKKSFLDMKHAKLFWKGDLILILLHGSIGCYIPATDLMHRFSLDRFKIQDSRILLALLRQMQVSPT